MSGEETVPMSTRLPVRVANLVRERARKFGSNESWVIRMCVMEMFRNELPGEVGKMVEEVKE